MAPAVCKARVKRPFMTYNFICRDCSYLQLLRTWLVAGKLAQQLCVHVAV
jgi:hypothetical protein